MPLTASQKRYLRGFAHALNPVVRVGQRGVTPAVLNELDGALEHHELVKVKLGEADRDARDAAIEALGAGCGAELVQAVGHVACFYRANAHDSQFALPGSANAAKSGMPAKPVDAGTPAKSAAPRKSAAPAKSAGSRKSAASAKRTAPRKSAPPTKYAAPRKSARPAKSARREKSAKR